jgi:hypothetical protein
VDHHERLRLRGVLALLIREGGVEEEVRLRRDQREREARGELGVGDLGRRLVDRV